MSTDRKVIWSYIFSIISFLISFFVGPFYPGIPLIYRIFIVVTFVIVGLCILLWKNIIKIFNLILNRFPSIKACLQRSQERRGLSETNKLFYNAAYKAVRKHSSRYLESLKTTYPNKVTFTEYSRMVTEVQKVARDKYKDKARFFTALCLSPCDWINYFEDNNKISEDWEKYKKEISSIQVTNRLFRCLLWLDDKIKIPKNSKKVFLSCRNKICQELHSYIVLPEEDGKKPIPTEERKKILDYLKNEEGWKNLDKCYEELTIYPQAYLLLPHDSKDVETHHRITVDKKNYEILQVGDYFIHEFHMDDNHSLGKEISPYQYRKLYYEGKFPEDFFLVGKYDGTNYEWVFGFAADVEGSLDRTKLWLLWPDHKNIAKDKGMTEERFRFHNIANLASSILKTAPMPKLKDLMKKNISGKRSYK
ncbi:MAG: hypothetical protein JSW60_03610 [Thermoplasmatales archaeon]|nr:MAG: hypothetical protein JSW60_03610 [Thermoplasmatales archaeon]